MARMDYLKKKKRLKISPQTCDKLKKKKSTKLFIKEFNNHLSAYSFLRLGFALFYFASLHFAIIMFYFAFVTCIYKEYFRK